MVSILNRLVAGAAVALLWGTAAFASCTGQLTPGEVCGVAGSSNAVPSGASLINARNPMPRYLAALLFAASLLFSTGAQAVCTGQFNGGEVCGNNGTTVGNPGPTPNPVLGVPGSVLGSVTFAGATSGTASIVPQANAGNSTLMLPNTSGTIPSTATSPVVLSNTTGNISCPTCLTTTGSFANPTAQVGLSTVNGSATTAMRSDASPPLDQSISPTWTGTHTFTNSLLRLLGSSTGYTTFTSANGGASNFTLTFPAVTDTLAALGTAQTWTALQKYTNGDLGLLGSSTGYTLLESGLSGAGNNTLTLPTTSSDTLAALGTAQTWTALQQFNDGDFALKGSASGTLVQHAAAAAESSVLTWPAGTTDFTATGSAHYVVRQSSAGAALTVGQLACSDLSDSVSGCSGTASSITVGNPVIGGTNSYLLGISSGGNLASQQFATLAQGGLGGDQSAATVGQVPIYPGSGGAAVPGSLPSIAGIATLNQGGLGGSQAAATINQIPVFNGSAAAVPTSASNWFDVAYCNSVGYLIARFVGAWTCAQGLPINMVWMGADNTGVVDATTIIQNVVNANTAGNPLFFPAGTYLFTGITSSNPVYVYGVGNGAGPGAGAQSSTYDTVFLNNSSTGTMWHITSLYPSQFHDFQCNVPLALRPMTSGSCIYLDTSGTATQANSKIYRVGFTNLFNDIDILRPSWPDIFDNYFDTYTDGAIICTTSSGIESSCGHISHNYFFGTYSGTGSTIYSEVGYIDVHDNEILGNAYGVQINVKNNPAGFIKIHDNTIENFGTEGILVQTGDGNIASMLMIQNNEFSDNANTPVAAIFVSDNSTTPSWITDINISGNISRNTTASGGRHIWVGAGSNVIIAHNVIQELGSNSPQGISIGGATTNAGLISPIQVLDNSFIGTYTVKYQVSGGNPVIRDLSSGMTVAQILAIGAGKGSQFYASDATVPSSAPCTGGGAGSLLLIESGTSRCP